MPAIREKMRGYPLWIALLILAAGVGAAAIHYGAKPAKPAVAGKVTVVGRGDLQTAVAATGSISPVNSVDISSKITGLIREVRVNENDRVTAGQVLIRLDDTRLRSQVAQTQAWLTNAAASYARIRQLAASGAVSGQRLDAARTDYEVAQASHADAVSQLADTVIRSPIDGMVIGRPIPAGQTVSPGISTPMVLMTVADLAKLQILVQVDETDIGKVAAGQKVSFAVDAYPGKAFAGTVSNVSGKANVQQNVVYYPVTVHIEAHGGLLRPAMTARVSILVGESKDTLIIPLAAVREGKGQYYVQRLVNGKVQHVAIKTGIRSDDKMEVTAGLNAGDQIVLPAGKPPGNAGGQGAGTRTPVNIFRPSVH